MPRISGDPLQKITLNLYAVDIAALRQFYGHGWSEQVREWVKDRLRTMRVVEDETEPYVIGDLNE